MELSHWNVHSLIDKLLKAGFTTTFNFEQPWHRKFYKT